MATAHILTEDLVATFGGDRWRRFPADKWEALKANRAWSTLIEPWLRLQGIPIPAEQPTTDTSTQKYAEFGGQIDGNHTATGPLFLKSSAVIYGTLDMQGHDLMIAGRVDGDVVNVGVFYQVKGSKVYGDVECQTFEQFEGAVVDGDVTYETLMQMNGQVYGHMTQRASRMISGRM